MIDRICALLRRGLPVHENVGLLSLDGDTVPTDGSSGYQPGCIFQKTDGSAGTVFYINEGTASSCDFNAVAALTAAQEASITNAKALLSATPGVATASKALILDSNGRVASGSFVIEDMVAGTGISTATNVICEHRVTKFGGIFKTEIMVDMTGLNDGDTAADVIGKDGDTPNCHIGQITAAKNGTIFAGRKSCIEVPAGGDVDVDLWTANEATLAQDTAISAATGEAQLLNHGDWAAGEVDILTAFPPADDHLYLVTGSQGSDADYTGGIFLIELWGK